MPSPRRRPHELDREPWYARLISGAVGRPIAAATLASTAILLGGVAGIAYGFLHYFESSEDAAARDRRWHTSAMWAQREAAELRSLHFTVAARVCRLSKRDEESCTELDKQAQAAAARMGDIQRAIAAQSQ